MICQLCGKVMPEIPIDYVIYQPHKDTTIPLEVCGRCYILTDILKTLKEIKDGKPR